MGLIRKIFWVAVTLVFTMLFSVLFEYGTQDYSKNLQGEIKALRDFFKPVPRKKDASDTIPPK
ncbi:hypothetical protein AYO41_02760 [Verrucomicrobia bacterium SCGC AG-212-E04]|nr:hypothetical protein AYO41_02760 [Verrucomicrobia bacterium SCGC AG-212-E04]